MYLAKHKLLKLSSFKRELAANPNKAIALFKGQIKDALATLAEYQHQGVPANDILQVYCWMIDQLVVLAFEQHFDDINNDDLTIQLLAVGGYGRGELHPYSDIDLLILLKQDQFVSLTEPLEAFVRFLWDIGLEVGHSIRSIKECVKEAKADIKTQTNLLEARHLSGETSLFDQVDRQIRSNRVWPNERFFEGKVQEQRERYAEYDLSAYTLEPNLKESPGGLRDLHTVLWVYNRRYGTRSFSEMRDAGHISEDEYRMVVRARNMLWKLRTALHLLSKRHEDRLLFDAQRELAQQYGYEDNKQALAVEQLMKRYYRTVQNIIHLNELLLDNYRVKNHRSFLRARTRNIDEQFVIEGKMINAVDASIFQKDPTSFFRLFTLMQDHKISAIHPDAVRAMRSNFATINADFRNNERVKELFIKLFKFDGITLTNALFRMNAYGVLGAYIPAFGAIVGQMQHDLFHVYTVDGHTLKVIENLTRLRKYPEEYELPSSVLASLHKPERLFLAALFHDIAKGRGGDHSELGAVDGYEFAISHNLSEYDAKLIAWLVEKHLFMSHFSQRRDISDPEVIDEFAAIVGDQEHLDNLYLLTHADIRGTSPKVWNAWKGQLLLELYQATRQALRRGQTEPINATEHIADDKKEALALLEGEKFNADHLEQFWQTLSDDYFIRNEPYYVAWHAKALSQASVISSPIVSVRYSERFEANMFFVFSAQSNSLLTEVTHAFDRLDLNITEARMHSTTGGYILYSFTAYAADESNIRKKGYMAFLEETIREMILEGGEAAKITRKRASRAMKHFPIEVKVAFTQHEKHTIMEVVAQDQPGLLHNVALILNSYDCRLLSAKISTLGERVEDVFFISDYADEPITDNDVLTALEREISLALDTRPQEKIAS